MNLSTVIRARINGWRRRLWRRVFFRMLFGEAGQGGELLPLTRLSPTVCIEHPEGLQLADDVFIGHFNFIEASGGVHIGRGVQITNFVSIVSHSTHRSVRVAAALSGQPALLEGAERAGDMRATIEIGAHSFIGPHSTIEAGARLGRACLVQAHSRVRGAFEDFSVIGGQPARALGNVRQADRRWLTAHPEWLPAYEAWVARVAEVE
ncbi:MAG: acyltransferase [Burkholderiaceae bacterium]|jgi:acetyltransferase-like isoleucine patch superfamily enzyme|nr:acyltransferase [Burkholderiaceae bacterium]